MILERMPAVQNLSATEKLQLVAELCDDLAAHPLAIPVPAEQLEELDRRMAAYRSDPSSATTWEAVKQRMLGATPP
jgi:putative addiction module component (TIGR02574 family)